MLKIGAFKVTQSATTERRATYVYTIYTVSGYDLVAAHDHRASLGEQHLPLRAQSCVSV